MSDCGGGASGGGAARRFSVAQARPKSSARISPGGFDGIIDLSVKSLRKAVSNIGSGLFCRDFGVYMVVHQSGVVVLLVGLGVYTFSLSVLFVVPG